VHEIFDDLVGVSGDTSGDRGMYSAIRLSKPSGSSPPGISVALTAGSQSDGNDGDASGQGHSCPHKSLLTSLISDHNIEIRQAKFCFKHLLMLKTPKRPDGFVPLFSSELYWRRAISLFVPFGSFFTVKYLPNYTPYEKKVVQLSQYVMAPIGSLCTILVWGCVGMSLAGLLEVRTLAEIMTTSVFYWIVASMAQASREASNHSLEGLKKRTEWQIKLYCLRYDRISTISPFTETGNELTALHFFTLVMKRSVDCESLLNYITQVPAHVYAMEESMKKRSSAGGERRKSIALEVANIIADNENADTPPRDSSGCTETVDNSEDMDVDSDRDRMSMNLFESSNSEKISNLPSSISSITKITKEREEKRDTSRGVLSDVDQKRLDDAASLAKERLNPFRIDSTFKGLVLVSAICMALLPSVVAALKSSSSLFSAEHPTADTVVDVATSVTSAVGFLMIGFVILGSALKDTNALNSALRTLLEAVSLDSEGNIRELITMRSINVRLNNMKNLESLIKVINATSSFTHYRCEFHVQAFVRLGSLAIAAVFAVLVRSIIKGSLGGVTDEEDHMEDDADTSTDRWMILILAQGGVIAVATLKVLHNVASCYSKLTKGVVDVLIAQRRLNALSILREEGTKSDRAALAAVNSRIDLYVEQVNAAPPIYLGGVLPLTKINLAKIGAVTGGSILSTLLRMKTNM
jgi:hypothetical protein